MEAAIGIDRLSAPVSYKYIIIRAIHNTPQVKMINLFLSNTKLFKPLDEQLMSNSPYARLIRLPISIYSPFISSFAI